MNSLTKKRISFSIFNEADYSTRQFTVSRMAFLITVLSVCVAVCLTGLIAFRCRNLRKIIPAATLLEETSISQQYMLAAQNEQLNLLNEKITGLGEKFQQLQEMQNKIYKIGRIEQPVNHENFFGIGGARAEDTDKINDSKNDSVLNNSNDTNHQPGNTLKNKIAFDPPLINGRMFALDHSDFCTNPIACIPYTIPTGETLTKKNQHLLPGQNNYYRAGASKTVQSNEIISPANGIITFVDVTSSSNDNKIIIDHGHGYVTRYACLKNVIKKTGEFVLKGEVIGYAETGSSETPSQFSCEIILNGLPVNPEKRIIHDPFLL